MDHTSAGAHGRAGEKELVCPPSRASEPIESSISSEAGFTATDNDHCCSSHCLLSWAEAYGLWCAQNIIHSTFVTNLLDFEVFYLYNLFESLKITVNKPAGKQIVEPSISPP